MKKLDQPSRKKPGINPARLMESIENARAMLESAYVYINDGTWTPSSALYKLARCQFHVADAMAEMSYWLPRNAVKAKPKSKRAK